MAEDNLPDATGAGADPQEMTPGTPEATSDQTRKPATKDSENKKMHDKHDTIGVRNQTNKRLTLNFELEQGQAREVTFAPLQLRRLSVSENQIQAYKELDRRGLILLQHKSQPEQDRTTEDNTSILFAVGVPYFIIGTSMNESFPDYALYYWIGVPVALVLFGILSRIFSFITDRLGWITVQRGAAQSLTLLLVMVIGLGLTAATIYFFGDGPTLLRSGPSLTLLTRLLQMIFITTASLLPALLYYLFDRQKLGTLRERFEHQIFNLDPMVETLGDVQAKYGSQLDELYGRDSITSSGRLVPGNRGPILVCTLVITAGWIMTLQPIGTGAVVETPSAMLSLFFPQSALLIVGFLGAYYFALNMILRRYTREDLQPKAYSHIAVRILIVTISAWVIEMLMGVNTSTRALIFIIGIVPDTFITAIQEIVRSNRLVTSVLPQLQEKHPLTGLEGIDLYDRARLAEEGITNVESLAHHDLIDLILATRIPVPRLVDWVDQAILYLHLADEVTIDENHEQIPKTLHSLKKYGIRNATNLEKIIHEPELSESLVEYFDGSKAEKDSNDGLTPGRIMTIYTALKDDDWLENIRHWRKSRDLESLSVKIGLNGVLQQFPPVHAPA